ncbi:MAG: signal peptidase II [Puniceicoccales bacterium]|jgi:signal peptidase II|nr:signal peptidase II [Puniceicoccales bacterium]
MIWFWAVTTIVFGFDQWAKFMVSAYAQESTPIIGSFLHLSRTTNDGAAWGILSGQRLLLIIINSCVIAGIIIFRKKLNLNVRSRGVAFGLLLGGILGNFLDRLRFGAVIDFIDVRLPFYRWPTFNFADAAICIGVLILLLTVE